MQPPTLPILTLLRILPDGIHSELLARVLSHLTGGPRYQQLLSRLDGTRLEVLIRDSGTCLGFAILRGKVNRADDTGTPTLHISGTLEGFWRLLSRQNNIEQLERQGQLAINSDEQARAQMEQLLHEAHFDLQRHLTALLGPGPARHFINLLDDRQKPHPH